LNRFLYFGFLGFLGAVILHIMMILLLSSHVMQESHLQRLATSVPRYQFSPLTNDDPIMTTLDPAFVVRFCHFDLSLGPVSLTASGMVPFWSLSLYTPDGSNIYSLNSSTSTTDSLDLILGDTIGIMDYRQSLDDNTHNMILSTHDIVEGFVLLRVFVPSSDWTLAADNFLQSASCRQIE